jgi:hypothetical protein
MIQNKSSLKGHLVEVPNEPKQTKEFGSLPFIGKAQRSVSSYTLTKFVVLETLKSLEIPTHGCNDFISIDVTELDLQLSQHPCFVPLVTDVIKEIYNPNKRARLEKTRLVFNLPEKVVKKVTFDPPIITENIKEQSGVNEHLCEVPMEQKETKEFGSLPIIGKAQRSIYSFMLTMKGNNN